MENPKTPGNNLRWCLCGHVEQAHHPKSWSCRVEGCTCDRFNASGFPSFEEVEHMENYWKEKAQEAIQNEEKLQAVTNALNKALSREYHHAKQLEKLERERDYYHNEAIRLGKIALEIAEQRDNLLDPEEKPA